MEGWGGLDYPSAGTVNESGTGADAGDVPPTKSTTIGSADVHGPRQIVVKRPIRIDGDVAYIPLTRGYEAVIDAVDIPLVEGFNWSTAIPCTKPYAVRRVPGGTCLYLHRAIAKPPPYLQVDHIDNDGLNNRRSNLRICTGIENRQNLGPRRHNRLGIKGVYQTPRSPRFYARITWQGVKHHLGAYDTASEAQAAYVKAAGLLGAGEFLRIEW